MEAGTPTVAFLGTAIDTTYPAANVKLRQRIEKGGGAVCSEYPPGYQGKQKGTFLARNRLIAGLSEVLCVAEARIRSGTLNTVSHAESLGRPVLAEEGDSAPEPVVHVVRELGYVLRQLYLVRYFVWGGTAALLLLCVILRATAFSRWKKRQQKLMEENFRRFGEKYAQDDEDMDY